MEQATKALIAKKMERASQDLRFARSLQAEKGYRQAINRDAFNARQDADYSDLIEFGPVRTAEVLADALEFVQSIEQFLREQQALD